MNQQCLFPADFYLPSLEGDWSRWACIACDQFTSEPSYWEKVEALVGDAPSAYRLILPECRLQQEDEEIPKIHSTMHRYLSERILKFVGNGYILTARMTKNGIRLGLVVALDLEQYDYRKQTKAPVRATEQTIESRIPARVKIRRGAEVELPHILLLMNDKEDCLLSRLYDQRNELQKLYDFDLMMGGGHISGYALFSENDKKNVEQLLSQLQGNDGLVYAVGDGNHSLASAKAYWQELRQGLSDEEAAVHPARYALVELVSIHSKALIFAPIHRVIFHAKMKTLLMDWNLWSRARFGEHFQPGESIRILSGDEESKLVIPKGEMGVAVLQAFLDEWLTNHLEASIDYIHGEESLIQLCQKEETVGFFLPVPDKNGLFEGVAKGGSLPRKTFSMGEAQEKRYYLECRKIVP